MWIDCNAEKRWFLWPNAYFCYLDTEQDEIVGIHQKYPEIEGGVVLVATPEFLNNNNFGPEIYQNAWHNLLNTARLSDGRP